jgi:hypothetical protein
VRTKAFGSPPSCSMARSLRSHRAGCGISGRARAAATTRETLYIACLLGRALDRDPGGNASCFTIRYAFRLFPQLNKIRITTTMTDSSKSNNKVQLQLFENSNGENELHGHDVTPSSVQIMEGLHSKLRNTDFEARRHKNDAFHIVYRACRRS